MVDAVNSLGGYAAPVHITNNPFDITSSNVQGYAVTHKFGSNLAVGTNIEDVWTQGGVYTWLTAATTIEAVSSDNNDIAGGSGARTITVQGLDADFMSIEEDITMAGTVASSSSTNEFLRINRAFVKDAGAYSSTTAGGNAGTITIRTSSGGATHALIDFYTDLSTDFGMGQTQISRYTVPSSKTVYIASYHLTVEATKSVTFFFWQRKNADTVSAPFTSRRLIKRFDGVADRFSPQIITPLGPYEEKTDLWWSAATATGTSSVSVDFEIIEVNN